jgi:hypothetical protein
MFTEPILPLAVLIEIGNLHQSPGADQCICLLGGPLGAERVSHFHFDASK